MTLRLYLFGAPRIERDGQIVHLDTRKAIALIAYLVMQGDYQRRDTLGALLWAENDHTGARGALRRTLSVLNSALTGNGLLIEREAVAFDPLTIWCDVSRFIEAIDQCTGHGHPLHDICTRCLEPLTQAVALYNGDFLQGFSLRDSAEFDLWQLQQTEHLRRLYGLTLDKLVCLHTHAERYGEAIAYATKWLALDPLHETARRQLMQLYVWSGQRSLAIRQYHECVRVLEQELGVSPLDETTRLYQQIMENAIKPRAAVVQSALPAPVTQDRFEPPLVGREREIEAMEQVYHALSGQRTVIVIEGEAGIGKTRLAETFINRRRAEGTFVVVLRCSESETHIAYAPIIHALREAVGSSKLAALDHHWFGELARLLPEVHALRRDLPAYVPDSVAQSRLYEAICQALETLLASERPSVLVIEDLQWADGAMLDWASYWLRRRSTVSQLGLLTWRSEEVPRSHRIRLLMGDYVRGGELLHVIAPQRLSRSQVQQLITAVQLPESPDLLERIYRESEGLPLFVHEYQALLYTNPALLHETEWHIPLGIHKLLQSRIAQVSEIAHQILDAAAVIGHSFDLDLVRESSGRGEEETVDSADELQRRGILKEGSGAVPTYEFYHEKLRAVVYHDLSMARKRLLHRRVATALLKRVGQTDALNATAALIAAHFQSGGQDTEAADFYARAGRHARSLYANREALSYFERALALGSPTHADLYESMGDLHTIMGNYRAALHSYESGKAHTDSTRHPSFEQKLGQVYHRLGEWQLADSYYLTGLAALPPDARSEHASMLTDRSLTKYAMGEAALAFLLAQDAVEAAEQANSVRVKAQAHNVMGLLARKQKHFELAAKHLYASLSLVESLNDEGVYVAVLNNLGLLHMEIHQYGDAQRLFEAALEKCQRLGDLHREAALHNNLADLFHALDMPQQALIHLKRAVSLFVQVGQQDTEIRAEIWKLTEW